MRDEGDYREMHDFIGAGIRTRAIRSRHIGKHKPVIPELFAGAHCLPGQQVIPQPPQLLLSNGSTHMPLQQIPGLDVPLAEQRLPSRADAQPSGLHMLK